jgi:hypothetical protein
MPLYSTYLFWLECQPHAVVREPRDGDLRARTYGIRRFALLANTTRDIIVTVTNCACESHRVVGFSHCSRIPHVTIHSRIVHGKRLPNGWAHANERRTTVQGGRLGKNRDNNPMAALRLADIARQQQAHLGEFKHIGLRECGPFGIDEKRQRDFGAV